MPKLSFLRIALSGLAVLTATLGSSIAHGQFQFHYGKKPVPPFILTTISGEKITSESLKGKVVLIDFWATWCGPCKMASPAMEQLYQKYKKKGLVVIGADTLEQTDGPAGAKNYKAEHKFNYTFCYNDDGLAKSFGIASLPAFAIIDKKGIVQGTISGIPRVNPVPTIVKTFSTKVDMLLKE